MNYILDGKKTVKCDDITTWAKSFDMKNRHVADATEGGVRVSTVFLGIDHQYGEGPSLLFETMIFGGENDGYQERYQTWELAEEGHKAACNLAGVKP